MKPLYLYSDARLIGILNTKKKPHQARKAQCAFVVYDPESDYVLMQRSFVFKFQKIVDINYAETFASLLGLFYFYPFRQSNVPLVLFVDNAHAASVLYGKDKTSDIAEEISKYMQLLKPVVSRIVGSKNMADTPSRWKNPEPFDSVD